MANSNNTNRNRGITIPKILEIKDIITIVGAIVVATSSWWMFQARIAVLERNNYHLVEENQQIKSSMETLTNKIHAMDIKIHENSIVIRNNYREMTNSLYHRSNQEYNNTKSGNTKK